MGNHEERIMGRMLNLTPHALLFTIAAIGIAEAAYLVKTRRREAAPVCPIGQDCSTVLSSRYNHLFGIHNDILGLLFYIVFAAATALLVLETFEASLLLNAMGVMLVGATIMSLFLIYLQANVIRAWCFWCVMSAATVGLMDIIMLTATLS